MLSDICSQFHVTTSFLLNKVKSVLLYGRETWKETREIQKKFQSYVNRCLRFIFGIWWPNVTSNEDLWERTKQKEIWKEIRYRKWTWIGHIEAR
jgi:hypothetical protein